jgi:hypothetical protein
LYPSVISTALYPSVISTVHVVILHQ